MATVQHTAAKRDTLSEAHQEALREFSAILSGRGLHPALAWLNARTRHRFTGVYAFESLLLRNLCMFDRENPDLRVGSDGLMEETYCSITGQGRKPFTLEDSSTDGRVAKHAARSSVISYCGVPLLTSEGTAFGTLCHFDLRPRIVPMSEIPLMESAAPLVLETVCGSGTANR
jgi:GAF domain-containing protein